MPKELKTEQKAKFSIENFRNMTQEERRTITLKERLEDIDKLEIMLFKLFCPDHKHPREHLITI